MCLSPCACSQGTQRNIKDATSRCINCNNPVSFSVSSHRYTPYDGPTRSIALFFCVDCSTLQFSKYDYHKFIVKSNQPIICELINADNIRRIELRKKEYREQIKKFNDMTVDLKTKIFEMVKLNVLYSKHCTHSYTQLKKNFMMIQNH